MKTMEIVVTALQIVSGGVSTVVAVLNLHWALRTRRNDADE